MAHREATYTQHTLQSYIIHEYCTYSDDQHDEEDDGHDEERDEM
jgi:hypothetical protein